MTRVIAGALGGRRLTVPPSGTRPTSERVREALFSALEHEPGLAGVDVLDLCAGSGALGIEALSRGAGHALFIESDRRAAAVLRRNLAGLGLADRSEGRAEVRAATVEVVLARPADRAYQVVLADPPYDLPAATISGWLVDADRNGWLAPGATVVVERRRERRGPGFAFPGVISERGERRYGDTVLHVGVRYRSGP